MFTIVGRFLIATTTTTTTIHKLNYPNKFTKTKKKKEINKKKIDHRPPKHDEPLELEGSEIGAGATPSSARLAHVAESN